MVVTYVTAFSSPFLRDQRKKSRIGRVRAQHTVLDLTSYMKLFHIFGSYFPFGFWTSETCYRQVYESYYWLATNIGLILNLGSISVKLGPWRIREVHYWFMIIGFNKIEWLLLSFWGTWLSLMVLLTYKSNPRKVMSQFLTFEIMTAFNM